MLSSLAFGVITEYSKCDISTKRMCPEKQRFIGRDSVLALINLGPYALFFQGCSCGIGLHGSSIPARSGTRPYISVVGVSASIQNRLGLKSFHST
jgi:hypothetical protein